MQTFVVIDHTLSFINIKEEGIICKFLKDFWNRPSAGLGTYELFNKLIWIQSNQTISHKIMNKWTNPNITKYRLTLLS